MTPATVVTHRSSRSTAAPARGQRGWLFAVAPFVGVLACGAPTDVSTGRSSAALLGPGYDLDPPLPGNSEDGGQMVAAIAANGDDALVVYVSRVWGVEAAYLAARFGASGVVPPREVPPVRRLTPVEEGYVGVAPNEWLKSAALVSSPWSPEALALIGPSDVLVARFVTASGDLLEDVAIAAPQFVCTAGPSNDGDDCPARIACDAAGSCVVVWHGGTTLQASGFGRDVAASPAQTVARADLPAEVAAGPAGFAVVYGVGSGVDRETTFQRITDRGAPIGAPVSLARGTSDEIIVSTTDGFAVAWAVPLEADPTTVQYVVTRLDASGAQLRAPTSFTAPREGTSAWVAGPGLAGLGERLVFSPVGDHPYLVDTDGAVTSIDAVSADAQVVVVGDELLAALWSFDSDVVGQVFDVDLNAAVGTALVSATDNSQTFGLAAAAADGAVVVWHDNRFEAAGIYRTWLDAQGCPSEPARLLWAAEDRLDAGLTAVASDGRTLLTVRAHPDPAGGSNTFSALLFARDGVDPLVSEAVPYVSQLLAFPSSGGYWLFSGDELWAFDEAGALSQKSTPVDLARVWGAPVASAERAEAIVVTAHDLPAVDPVRSVLANCDLPIDESATDLVVRATVLDQRGNEMFPPTELDVVPADCNRIPVLVSEGDGYLVSWPSPEGRKIARLGPDGVPREAPVVVQELANALAVVALPGGYAWLVTVSTTAYQQHGGEMTVVTTDTDFRVVEKETMAPPDHQYVSLVPVGDSAIAVSEREVRWPARSRIYGIHFDDTACGSAEAGADAAPRGDGVAVSSAEGGGGCACRASPRNRASSFPLGVLMAGAALLAVRARKGR